VREQQPDAHLLPGQQGVLGSPHFVHLELEEPGVPLQYEFASLQAGPVEQQGALVSPHFTHVEVDELQTAPASVHVDPEQHLWPIFPHKHWPFVQMPEEYPQDVPLA